MADAPDTTNPSRRLFLAAGPAAAVFGNLSATARERSNGALVVACRKALAAHQAYNDLALTEDEPRLHALAEIEQEGVTFAIGAGAFGSTDLKAKAVLLRAQLPQNRDCCDVWPHAGDADKLAWFLIKDILMLNGAEVA